MEGQIVQITYKFVGVRDKYVEENLPYAEPIASVSGLRWKIWILSEERGEAGGVYYFADRVSAQAFLDGPIISEMKGDPSLSIRTFDVLEELTAVTRGPIEQAAR